MFPFLLFCSLSLQDVHYARLAMATYENDMDHEGIDLDPTLQPVLRAVKMCDRAIARSAALEQIKRITLQPKVCVEMRFLVFTLTQ